MTPDPKTPEAILAANLVALMQAHVQRYGPLPDAAGDALKSALGALQQEESRDGLDQKSVPERIYLVLTRRDGFVRREPCPRSGPPLMWHVPNPLRPVARFADAGLPMDPIPHTNFRRARWLSETEIEYLED